MKKTLLLVAMLMAVMFAAQTADAALLGVKDAFGFPDIDFDNGGFAEWDADANHFMVRCTDKTLLPSFGAEYLSLFGDDRKISLELDIYFDDNGGLLEGWMVERVVRGPFDLEGDTYQLDDIVLAGDVIAVGHGDGANFDQFDAILDNASGLFIDNGLWPAEGRIGMFMFAEVLNGWTGSFDEDFRLDRFKGDKSHLVPEPASLLLLGSGLIGLAAVGRKKKKIA